MKMVPILVLIFFVLSISLSAQEADSTRVDSTYLKMFKQRLTEMESVEKEQKTRLEALQRDLLRIEGAKRIIGMFIKDEEIKLKADNKKKEDAKKDN